MMVAAVAETQRYSSRTSAGTFRRRTLIAVGLIVSDLASFAIADAMIHMLTIAPGLSLFPGAASGQVGSTFDLFAILAAIFIIARYIAGDYSRRQLFWDGARSTTGALLIFGVIYLAAVWLLEPRGLLLSAAVWLLFIAGLPSARQLMRIALGRLGVWYQPSAIIGTGPTAQEVYPVLGNQLSLGLDVRWIVPENADKVIPAPLAALTPIHASYDNLTDSLIAVGCRQVILVLDDNIPINQAELIDQLVGSHIGVSVVPSLRRLPLFGMSTNYFFGKDFLLLQVRNNLARLPQRFVKRVIDIVGSLLALIVLSPVLALICFLIRREGGGPIFFIQDRVGRGCRDFRCFKFRTMIIDAEAEMARWEKENPILLARYRESNFKLSNDPRVTRIGGWLRRKSIDEFPQLINVLMGNMSLVGPRPLLRRELPYYGPTINLYACVRPGITGLWQISGRSHTTFSQRVSYDEWYIKNWTVWYDVVIMLQTLWYFFRSKDAY